MSLKMKKTRKDFGILAGLLISSALKILYYRLCRLKPAYANGR